MNALAFAIVPADDPRAGMGGPWREELHKIEERIASSEGDGLRARWESGKELALGRHGKQLPAGMLDKLAAELGASRQELQARMKFADKFQTNKEVSDAIRHFPSWFRVTHEALRTKPKPKAAEELSGASLTIRRFAKELTRMSPADLTRADREQLAVIGQYISVMFTEGAK